MQPVTGNTDQLTARLSELGQLVGFKRLYAANNKTTQMKHNNMFTVGPPRTLGFSCSIASPMLSVLILAIFALLSSVHCWQENTVGVKSSAQSNLVNLNDILIHQQALIGQCKQLERRKLNELKQLIQFEQAHGRDELDLGDRLTLKLPAVCIYLLGAPAFKSSNEHDDATTTTTTTAASNAELLHNRVDMVNWIYDYEDLRQLRRDESVAAKAAAAEAAAKAKAKTNQRLQHHQLNRTRRQAGAEVEVDGAPSQSMAGGADEDDLTAANLLNEYWYDLNKLDNVGTNATTPEARQEEAERADFHTKVNELIGSEQFQMAVEKESKLISGYLSPVILVPGLAGSRLQVRVRGDKRKVNIICSKQTGWQETWLTLRWFLPVAIDCWIDNVRLEFDDSLSGFVRQPAGIEARVPDFGSVESVRHLDLKSPLLTEYYKTIIDRYEQLGYRADKNLFAAPYDFRLAPQQLNATFFPRLRKLIELASNNGALYKGQWVDSMDVGTGNGNGNSKRVTLVCHSMGCTHLLIFLRQQSAAWRQAKIRKLIALSAPWGGTIKALKALLVGEQFNLPMVSELKMRKLERTFPGVAHLLPQAEVFEQPNKYQVEYGNQPPLVQTPERTYSVNQLEGLLRDAGMARQWDWFEETAPLIDPSNPLPDVNIDCLHSLNIPTVETILFRKETDFPNGAYELIEGDGDGTVNHQSLLICGAWAAKMPERVKHKIIMNTSHSGMLKNKQVLEHITDDVVSSKY